jgi:hypothetical protein
MDRHRCEVTYTYMPTIKQASGRHEVPRRYVSAKMSRRRRCCERPWCGRVRYTPHFRLRGRKLSSPSPQGGGLGTRPARSSALLSAKRVTCAPAFLSPLGGSRFPVSGFSERRPDAQITLPIRLRTDQAVAKCFGFLAGPELGDDLPCPTVDDDECLQGGGLRSGPIKLPTYDASQEGAARRGIDANEGACRGPPDQSGHRLRESPIRNPCETRPRLS